MGQAWKFISNVLSQLLNIFKKAHYHEFPILDDNGEIVGYEIVTTRGGYSRHSTPNSGVKDSEEDQKPLEMGLSFTRWVFLHIPPKRYIPNQNYPPFETIFDQNRQRGCFYSADFSFPLCAKLIKLLCDLTNEFSLVFYPDFHFKLSNRPQSTKQQAPKGISGINILIKPLQIIEELESLRKRLFYTGLRSVRT